MEFMAGLVVLAAVVAVWLVRLLLRASQVPAAAGPVADPYAAEVAAFRRDLGDWLRG